MQKSSSDRNAGISLRVLFVLSAVSFLPWAVIAAGPQWWTDRGLVSPTATVNDYALVNQGQAKNAATQAYAELQANLPGGAGTNLTFVVTNFSTATNNYVPVNLGQLKNLAKPFYDRLIAVGYTTNYPWAGSTNTPNDYAPANIGQLKNLFSFDITYDSDTNGLPDWWEQNYFGHLGNDAASSPNGNGLTLLQDYQQGNDPANYYSQGGQTLTPVLSILGGNNQSSPQGTFTSQPLTVQVTGQGGTPFANAPVTFSVLQGGGLLAVANGTGAATASTLSLRTDANGQAAAYYQQPAAIGIVSQIAAGTGGQTVALTATSTLSENPFSAPTNLIATPGGYGEINLTWVNNASTATYIVIQQSLDGTTWTDTTTLADPAATSYTVTDLTQDQGYFFRIAAGK